MNEYLQNLYLICPCCLETRAFKHTILYSYYFGWYKQHLSLFHPIINLENDWFLGEVEKLVQGNINTYLLDKNAYLYHTHQWACNDCIEVEQAIIPNYDKQSYGMSGVIIAYTNLEKICERCHLNYVFSAKEQQYWYETLGFFIESVPKHCKDCRSIIRKTKVK
jgi:hypothetical protein